uniref:Uncharacterized protein n=1 Tax=Gossypium raimondii TaxID=29730 RepID=A0A0D2PNT8_GOSRA|nr:hypothetical protein B456_008G047900 [Gossypium raimondii]
MEDQEMKKQMQTLKHGIPKNSSSETEPEPEENTQEYMMVLTEVSIQRYLIRINIVINNEFQLVTIALFDIGVDQNSIGFSKTQQYYKNILVLIESVLFKHYTDSKDPKFITHSTTQILKIVQPRDWSENPNTPKKFPAKFTTKSGHHLYFIYWDYQMAWYPIQIPKLVPRMVELTKNTFTEQSIFFSQLCISWIVSWNYSYEQDQCTGIPLLIQNYRNKWWDQFNDEKYDSKYLDNFFNKNPRLYKFEAPDQTTAKFLQVKSTASVMLAQTKTKNEYKKLMVEMLSSMDSESEDEKSSASSIKMVDLADDTTSVTITRTKKHDAKERNE